MRGLRNHNEVTQEQYVAIDNKAEQFEKAAKIIRENRMACARLDIVIPDATVDTLIAVALHKPMMSKFLDAKCKHFATIEKAIENVTPDDILMYITELHVYGVFRLPDYLDFAREVSELYHDDRAVYNPKQVILSGLPQRIAFMCSGDQKFVNKIKDYCELHFKTTIQIKTDGDKTDIIVKEPILQNLEESRRAFKEFFAFVNTREPVSVFQLAQDVKEAKNVQYIMSSLGSHIDMAKIEDLVGKLGGFPVTVININTNNGNIVFGNAVINNNNNDKLAETIQWIAQNPPHHREINKDYYARYVASVVAVKIHNNMFGKLVKKSGYTYKKSSGVRFWVKE